METSIWPAVWAAVILVSLTVFGGLALFVTVLGLGDVRAMLRTLREQHEQGPDE